VSGVCVGSFFAGWQEIPEVEQASKDRSVSGFSREHSSTVALVRNLHTEHVSPQYHVVFDDKFETVYNDGKSSEEVDRICEELFVNSREHFVEDEYNEDGLLIYRPRPLNKV
jgi:hypothetical protein